MSRSINISELDVQSIKQNIIKYIKNDPTFSDYDFEGSGLNVLMDILAYNTHHTSFYLNMIANEMFLDTARVRDNVVSRAKMLGYKIKSKTASKMQVKLKLSPKEIADDIDVNSSLNKFNQSIKIEPENYTFSSTIDNKTYSFIPSKTRSATLSETKIVPNPSSDPTADTTYLKVPIYTINDLELIQGVFVSEIFTVDTTNPNQRFVLSNGNVDTSTISVSVRDSESSTDAVQFTQPTDTMRLDGVSTSFFVNEVESGLYEISFGDGVLGQSLISGNIVEVTYLVTDGVDANGIFKLSVPKNTTKYEIIEMEVINKAFGGSEKEDIDSIKFYAPKTFEGQNRAVTLRDYKTIIPKIYTQSSSVNVWGGEDNIPPAFGKVFISIRPTDGSTLTQFEKEDIKQKLKMDYSILTILPEVVDPDYTKLIISSKVKYDNESTILTEDELKDIVIENILKYNKKYMNEFGNYFRYSNFVANIDDTNEAITNNVTEIMLKMERPVDLKTKKQYIFNFNNEIKRNTLSSNGFMVPNVNRFVYIEDNGNGSLSFYYDDLGTKRYLNNYTGTIDYTSGVVVVNDIIINSVEYSNINLQLNVKPESFDIFPKRNQVLIIENEDINIEMIPDTDDYNNNYEVSSFRVSTLRRNNNSR